MRRVPGRRPGRKLCRASHGQRAMGSLDMSGPGVELLSARDFFATRGYQPQRRNTVSREGEWLANTTMEKPLAGARAAKGGDR